ncbi:TetR family transcriptional regulator [Frondihabitans sp. PhB188]|uniref:TetR/AcrR family transcriptional regulator n=1 Tax=Frondihabitans sp. PhB188 TaxID=2485200 RepID=UPI000F460D88|nr:TetR-like C-terminal domain-containing protein [Frondihabitans sp. PhB188]ROQ36557.1 TetR family transcriptional regulator [Frondihabitans sp. PhB188]
MPRTPLTPQTIVAAAADLADRDGFDAIVVSAVARQLGVQTASLYGHVRDREAILSGVQELALAELADAVGAAIAGRSRRDALVAMGDAQRDFARGHPGRWESLQRRADTGVVRSEAAARVSGQTVAVLRGYRLADDDIVHAARMSGATVAGFVALERTGAFDHRDQSVDESWRRSIDALDVVFTSWTPSVEEGAS